MLKKYKKLYIVHNISGDIMDLSIRKNVIENIKSDNYEDIITMINESVTTGDEIVLPGLGVILELFWSDLKIEDKEYIAKIIKKNITNK